MAGSRKWFIYTLDDDRGDFALELDEGNSEAVNAGTQDYLNNSTVVLALPRNVTPRKAVYQSADGNRTISCVVLTPTIYASIPTSVTTISDPISSGNTLFLKRVVPERIRLPFGTDTALNDGDAT